MTKKKFTPQEWAYIQRRSVEMQKFMRDVDFKLKRNYRYTSKQISAFWDTVRKVTYEQNIKLEEATTIVLKERLKK